MKRFIRGRSNIRILGRQHKGGEEVLQITFITSDDNGMRVKLSNLLTSSEREMQNAYETSKFIAQLDFLFNSINDIDN